MAFRKIKNYLGKWIYSQHNDDTNKLQTEVDDLGILTTNTLADTIDCNTANIEVMKSMLNRFETANSVMQQQIDELQEKLKDSCNKDSCNKDSCAKVQEALTGLETKIKESHCNILSVQHRTVIEEEACLMQERFKTRNPNLLRKWTGLILFALMFGWLVKNNCLIEKMSPNAI
ncbi:uncharacterized protein LOC119083730 [Bradysia coprophila]|uniref:uncharacterized protein LOC119083730 n=1 Tax=Bradysia coprophila TaxID=38358 RepID=UPI00187D7CCF|nr:uncharacterized protein LOC119083730 [Bradysia coprophila]